MSNLVVYDDAAYHRGAPAFSSKRLDPHNGGTHIGMYLAWIIVNRLESFSLRQTAPSPAEEVRSKQVTGRAFLFAHCAGRLTSDALNSEAQALTQSYYENQYLRDFDEVLVSKANGTYTVVDNWANYEKLAAVMNKRLLDFRGK